MSGPTLSGAPVSRAILRTERYGVGSADVVLVESPALVVGQRVTLKLGDRSWVGTLRPGGEFGATSYWTIVAGAGRWDTHVERRDYRDEGGVMLGRVLRDLATEAGELGLVLDAPDRSLGASWVRPAGPASDALRALVGGEWWVADDGVTHVGPRPATTLSSPPALTVSSYDPSTRRAVVAMADDAIAKLAPGVILSAPGLPAPLTVGAVVVRCDGGSLDVELFGERGPAELLAAIVLQLTAGVRYAPLHPYTVAEVDGSKASVKPSDARSIDLPEQPFLATAGGVPGLAVELEVGSPVFVLFPSADPGSPLILAYGAGVQPRKVSISASQEVAFSAASKFAVDAPSVELGGDVELAKGLATDLALGILRNAMVAHGWTVPDLGTVKTSKTKGA